MSHREKLLAGIAAGKCLTVWDLQTWQQIITLPRSAQGPSSIQFSPDLRWIILGNRDGTIEAWDLKRKVLATSWRAHRQRVIGLEFLPNSIQFVSASFDATAKLWDLERQTLLRSFPRALNSFRSLAISPDGERIAAGSYDGSIRLWSPATGQELGVLRTGKQAVGWVQFVGPKGDTLAWLPEFTSDSSPLRLCRAPSFEEIGEP